MNSNQLIDRPQYRPDGPTSRKPITPMTILAQTVRGKRFLTFVANLL
jgi:hypothetical protein